MSCVQECVKSLKKVLLEVVALLECYATLIVVGY
jgi:hypothetical protein